MGNFYVVLKYMFGIVCLAVAHLFFAEISLNGGFILGMLKSLPFWIVLFLFMDFKPWVSKDFAKDIGEEQK